MCECFSYNQKSCACSYLTLEKKRQRVVRVGLGVEEAVHSACVHLKDADLEKKRTGAPKAA